MQQCAIAGCPEYAENDWRVTFDSGESEVIPVCDAHSSDQRLAGKWAIVKNTKLIAGKRNTETHRLAPLGSCPRCGFADCGCVL